ncbi:MAG: AMP-binding protein [Verrucomicrobiales bacterium]|jgi:acyl-[acyl-carrier-protein]-phospholipid O-acyltransferase/long-chain-fatty-acid--[acyl-carrier-protein] ligase|nr:AMP-binding protein [Verrucomicrobiales bacterium]
MRLHTGLAAGGVGGARPAAAAEFFVGHPAAVHYYQRRWPRAAWLLGAAAQVMARLLAFIWRKICRVKRVCAWQPEPDGDWLLVTNRLSLYEALTLTADLGRRVCFLAHAQPAAAGWLARWPGWLPLRVVEREPAQALGDSVGLLRRQGWLVCLCADGLADEEVEKIIRRTRSNAVPVAVLPYSRLALTRNFRHFSGRGPARAFGVCYGGIIRTVDFSAARLRRDLLEMLSRVVESHPALKQHLADAAIRGLKKKLFRTVAIDTYVRGKKFSGGLLLTLAWLLAEKLETMTDQQRIGVVMPPGVGAMIANLACVLIGRTPVNLNFTMGRRANEHAIRQTGLDFIITSELVVQRMADFPWTARRFDVVDWLLALPRADILRRFGKVVCSPARWILEDLDVPPKGDNAEAGILFTSGSVGDPKGVPLSHRNILTNIAQIKAILPNNFVPSILGCLPTFHSFGFTVTLWWPMIGGPRVITCVSPLETGKIIEAIQRYRLALMITTPTFLRGYMKKATPAQLASLRLIVTGAEKLPLPLAAEFEEKLGVPVCEGYGMTEGSPVIGANLPDWTHVENGIAPPLARVIGSVGRPLPGVAIRVTRAESDDELPLDQSGMLWFRGGNIFNGYLGAAAETAQVLRDGWYLSGDLGRVDERGFLHIEGRLSRFSKIGGEMVPHGTVERHLLEALRPTLDEEFNVVVVGANSVKKGELLVLLTNRTLARETVRQVLTGRGLPNLWIPRLIRLEPVLPVMSNGKIDLKTCRQLAAETVLTVEGS